VSAPGAQAARRGGAMPVRLPRQSTARADGQTRLLALLACARLPAAAVATDERAAEPWPALRVEFDSRFGPVGVVPTRAGAPTARLCAPDGTPALREAADALEAAEPALAALERALGSTLTPRALAPMPPGDRVEVEFALPDGAGARVDATAATLRRLPAPAWREPPPDVLRYALVCGVRLGTVRLAAGAVQRLRAGDVLLPVDAFAAQPTVRVVAPDGGQVAALLDPAAGTLRFGVPLAQVNAMTPDPSPDTPDAAAAPDWTRLPVELAFELPRASVPLGVLAGLQPGAVIPIASDAAMLEVVIVNGGREVGRGELVAIGDGVGVRLRAPLGDCR
jgi:type III secretion system YscQ/HrcQ family protein